MAKSRSLAKVVVSKWQSEGRGARVRRSIGRPELRNLDPFLLLDEFEGAGKDGGGFPDHPHRGFETVSYLLEGEFTHEDFSGNRGVLGPGDLQWMTAGRGIVHSEMPGWEKTRGLQLWVNLARYTWSFPLFYNFFVCYLLGNTKWLSPRTRSCLHRISPLRQQMV